MSMNQIGVVTIGRNEGDRLVNCLCSLKAQLPDEMPIVYVDSGSTDGSLATAREMGVAAIALDPSRPFTMARGRNAGFDYLAKHHPELAYIQFIDGDCELVEGWLERAVAVLDESPAIAIVCGRRREKFPNASPYNRLADMEWNTPIGEAEGCGGDALIRIEALNRVDGYNGRLICGEEPEMCIRMRRQGWEIWRIGADMTRHDAAMTRFSQWWTRSVRSGWAVAEGAVMYGLPPERYMIRKSWSGLWWGAVLPLLALGLVLPTGGQSLLLLLAYPVLGWRIYQQRRRDRHDSPAHARLYAIFCVLSKFPQVIGQGKYWLSRWRKQPSTLIEYKSPFVTRGAKSG
ncbi:MAG: glycosyltransferase [Synechococcales bacterium]|nr:glycosyltransferase [Synechococcales bacterium]